MTTFYLVRHGKSDRVPGDPPLNAVGRRQAYRTAQVFARLPVDAVYTSPLARARETAQAIADQVGCTLNVDERLLERANYGDLPGQTRAEFIAMWRQCDADRDYVPVVGLSARANGARMAQWLRAVYAAFPHGTVVAGSHGGTITDFLLNTFSRDVLARYRPDFADHVGNCSITVLRFDGKEYALEQLAAVEHLDE